MKRIKVNGHILFNERGKEPRLFLPNTVYEVTDKVASNAFLKARIVFIEDVEKQKKADEPKAETIKEEPVKES